MSVPEPLTVKVPPLSVKEPATPTAPISALLQPEILDAAEAALSLPLDGLLDDALLDDGFVDGGLLDGTLLGDALLDGLGDDEGLPVVGETACARGAVGDEAASCASGVGTAGATGAMVLDE